MEGNDGAVNNTANNNSNPNAQNTTGQGMTNQSNNSTVDYNKIQAIVDGRNAKTEDSILKSYFQQQGLSAEEMKTAIQDFKNTKEQKEKEASQNAVNMQNENAALKEQIKQMQVDQAANNVALEIGVDPKIVPYLIKMADLSNVVDKDGNISNETIKTAFNNVLDALPQLKGTSQSQNNSGFQKIGGTSDNKQANVDDVLKEIFS